MGGVVAGRWVSDEGGEQVGEMQGESGDKKRVCRGQVADRPLPPVFGALSLLHSGMRQTGKTGSAA